MRAIKIDPANKTIEEIELAVAPNRSLRELRSIIGASCFQLIPLDQGICLLAAAVNEQDAGFGFVGGRPCHSRRSCCARRQMEKAEGFG